MTTEQKQKWTTATGDNVCKGIIVNPKEEAVLILRRIYSLVETPHWTSDRKYRIGELAQEAIKLLEANAE